MNKNESFKLQSNSELVEEILSHSARLPGTTTSTLLTRAAERILGLDAKIEALITENESLLKCNENIHSSTSRYDYSGTLNEFMESGEQYKMLCVATGKSGHEGIPSARTFRDIIKREKLPISVYQKQLENGKIIVNLIRIDKLDVN